MSYPFYKVCRVCGANLDPGERCSCCTAAFNEAVEAMTPEERHKLLAMVKESIKKGGART